MCIANDGGAIKSKPLFNVTLKMDVVQKTKSESRMLTIAYKKKKSNVLDQLIEGA